MQTIEQVLRDHGVADNEALVAALVDREDGMADLIRLAGVQFGLFPAIVQEVIYQIGLGTTPTEEQREHVRQQFLAAMEELRRMIEGQGN